MNEAHYPFVCFRKCWTHDGCRRCLVSDDGDVQELSVVENPSGHSGLGGSSNSGYGGSGFEMSGRTSGHCKLINVDAGQPIYNGRYSIKQSNSGSSTIFEFQMGSADSFLFATSDGRRWMHGPEEVRFEDRGHTGIFRWADFRLEVDDD